MKIAGIITAYMAICLFEIPGLIEKKYGRELVIFIAFLLPAFVLSVLQGAEIELPQIVPALGRVVEAILPGVVKCI